MRSFCSLKTFVVEVLFTKFKNKKVISDNIYLFNILTRLQVVVREVRNILYHLNITYYQSRYSVVTFIYNLIIITLT